MHGIFLAYYTLAHYIVSYTYPKPIFDVDINSFYIDKVFHYVLMASLGCRVQGCSLHKVIKLAKFIGGIS